MFVNTGQEFDGSDSGARPDEATVLSAAAIAADEARPLGHLGFSASYKRTLVQALTRRALSQAWQEAASTTTKTRGTS